MHKITPHQHHDLERHLAGALARAEVGIVPAHSAEERPVPTSAFPGPPRTLDCSGYPYNIRWPLQTIMQAENFILDRLPEGKKLVIIVGERHFRHIPTLLQHALLAAHQKQREKTPDRSFAYGYEIPHNYRHKAALRNLLEPFDHCQMPEDPDGVYSMKAYNLRTAAVSTRQAVSAMFDFCMDHTVSVSFNDLAHKISLELDTEKPTLMSLIDQSDPWTKSLVERHRPDLSGEKIIRFADRKPISDGFALSNIAIVENAMAHMERAKAKIYIQSCGLAHLFGYTPKNCAYADSLTALFLKRNVAVLPVALYASNKQNEFAPLAGNMWEECVKITNLALDGNTMPYQTVRRYVNAASGYNL